MDFSVLMNAARQSIRNCLLSERQTWSSNYLCWWKCYFEMYLRRISGPMFRDGVRADDSPVISKDVDWWFDECLSCCSFDAAAISFIALEHHSPRLIGLLGYRVETRILLPYVIAVVGYYIVWTLACSLPDSAGPVSLRSPSFRMVCLLGTVGTVESLPNQRSNREALTLGEGRVAPPVRICCCRVEFEIEY